MEPCHLFTIGYSSRDIASLRRLFGLRNVMIRLPSTFRRGLLRTIGLSLLSEEGKVNSGNESHWNIPRRQHLMIPFRRESQTATMHHYRATNHYESSLGKLYPLVLVLVERIKTPTLDATVVIVGRTNAKSLLDDSFLEESLAATKAASFDPTSVSSELLELTETKRQPSKR